MRERPIIFSAPMVRAILAGTKTQTRRVVKPRKDPDYGCELSPGEIAGDEHIARLCPYGQPGDRLWVREAFRLISGFDTDSPARVGERCLDAGYRTAWAPIRYEADCALRDWKHVGTPPHDGPPLAGKLRPGIHMPRWASRITLEITEVRVERLQDISEADAWAEGCTPGVLNAHGEPFPADVEHPGGYPDMWDNARDWYADLWDSIHGAGAFDANPWVWAVSFRRVAT